MKSGIFATTALIATAGVAAADISLSGDARMGITSVQTAAPNDQEAVFSSRMRVLFTASGQTDNGLSFGGSFRATSNGGGTSSVGASAVFVSGAFGTLTMGDITAANKAATSDLAGVGFTDEDAANKRNQFGYLGAETDNQNHAAIPAPARPFDGMQNDIFCEIKRYFA